MLFLRENAITLLMLGLIQAASVTSLVHSELPLDTLASPAWPSGLADAASWPASGPKEGAGAASISPEEAVPPFAMFLVETFAALEPAGLPSGRAPR